MGIIDSIKKLFGGGGDKAEVSGEPENKEEADEVEEQAQTNEESEEVKPEESELKTGE